MFYKVQNIQTQDQNPKPSFQVSGNSDFSELTETGRPSRSTDVHAVHVCTSADRPGRPSTLQCSRVDWVDRAVDR